MKIISNKRYKEFKLLLTNYNQLKFELSENNKFLADKNLALFNLSLNFNIRRCVIGKKGSGKTEFIQKKILPELKNYFLIDCSNEYNFVDINKKYVPSGANDAIKLKESPSIIELMADKTLIIEDSGIIANDLNWFLNLLKNKTVTNFIIVAESVKRIEPIIDYVDYIYDFGCFDMSNTFFKNNKHKIFIMNPEKV